MLWQTSFKCWHFSTLAKNRHFWAAWENQRALSLKSQSFGSPPRAWSRRSLHHFPIPRLFHVGFALQLRSWGKTDASSAALLLLLHQLSSLPPLPLGLFYGRASNTWPLPCIRPHVHNSIHSRIKDGEHVIKYKKELFELPQWKVSFCEVRPFPKIHVSVSFQQR